MKSTIPLATLAASTLFAVSTCRVHADEFDDAYVAGYATGYCSALSQRGEFGETNRDRAMHLDKVQKCMAEAKEVGRKLSETAKRITPR
jgi:hypothetical protein